MSSTSRPCRRKTIDHLMDCPPRVVYLLLWNMAGREPYLRARKWPWLVSSETDWCMYGRMWDKERRSQEYKKGSEQQGTENIKRQNQGV